MTPDARSRLTDSSRAPARGARAAILKATLLVLALAALALAAWRAPLGEYLTALLDYIRSLGVWGPAILALAYVVATVAMTPGVILTLGAGFLFGLVVGTVTVSVGSVLGATAAMLVGRYFVRGFVDAQADRFPRFAAVDQAVEREGFKIVLLTRLSPLFPFNALNYLYGATRVRVRDYVLASWIGMLPATVMYVYLGAAAKNLTQALNSDSQGGLWQNVLLGVGLVVTIVVTVYVSRLANRAIREYVPQRGDDGNTERENA